MNFNIIGVKKKTNVKNGMITQIHMVAVLLVLVLVQVVLVVPV